MPNKWGSFSLFSTKSGVFIHQKSGLVEPFWDVLGDVLIHCPLTTPVGYLGVFLYTPGQSHMTHPANEIHREDTKWIKTIIQSLLHIYHIYIKAKVNEWNPSSVTFPVLALQSLSGPGSTRTGSLDCIPARRSLVPIYLLGNSFVCYLRSSSSTTLGLSFIFFLGNTAIRVSTRPPHC